MMTRDAREMPLVWIDGEMTGLDPREDLLLEIAVVVTDAELNELGSFEAVLHQDRNLAVRMMDPEVLRMHTRSELIADLAVTTSETSIESVERQLIDFVHLHDAAGAPAAGSSIAFDRGFLAVVMPELNELLHYRSVDVSTVKELGRRFAPKVLASAPVKERLHRALADVRESIGELRHYVRAGMFRAVPGIDPTPEQIKAEALERFPELAPTYASLTYPAEAMRSHNRAAFKSGARWAALVASAGAAPQVAGGDHAALIAEARSRAEHPGTGSNTAQCLRECADALEAAGNAPVQVDGAKLAKVIAGVLDSAGVQTAMGEAWRVESHEVVSIRDAVAEWLLGGGR